jgi:hypothetical protein
MVAGGGIEDFLALPATPIYVAWKPLLSMRIFRAARKDARCIRLPSVPLATGSTMAREEIPNGANRLPRR